MAVSKEIRGGEWTGKWLVRWRTADRKQHKMSFNLKREADAWDAKRQVDTREGRYVDPAGGKTLVGAYAARWRDKLSHLKDSTLTRYQSIVDLHVLPAWKDWQIGKITPGDVNGWIARLTAQGLKVGSVRQIHRVLSLILDAAIADGLISRNLAKGVRLPRPVRSEPRYLTPGQVGELVAAGADDGLTFLTLAFTGLRFGELAALKVRRLDAERGRLDVVESVSEVGSRLV